MCQKVINFTRIFMKKVGCKKLLEHSRNPQHRVTCLWRSEENRKFLARMVVRSSAVSLLHALCKKYLVKSNNNPSRRGRHSFSKLAVGDRLISFGFGVLTSRFMRIESSSDRPRLFLRWGQTETKTLSEFLARVEIVLYRRSESPMPDVYGPQRLIACVNARRLTGPKHLCAVGQQTRANADNVRLGHQGVVNKR